MKPIATALAILFSTLAPLTVGCSASTGNEPVGSSTEAESNDGSHGNERALGYLRSHGYDCVWSNSYDCLMCGKNGDPTTWFCDDHGICSSAPPPAPTHAPVITPHPITGPISGISLDAPARVEATLDDPAASAAGTIIACPLGDPSCTPPLPAIVTGTWERHAGTLTETLTLRTDASYSLVETATPACFRAPCPESPTTIHQTAGTYAVNGAVVALSPTTEDPNLPDAWDIVRGIPVPPVGTAATAESALIVAPVVALHAVERGSDVRLTRATSTADCPTGTTPCYQCGAYPPGGVCQTFVCLPPTQRCLPVP